MGCSTTSRGQSEGRLVVSKVYTTPFPYFGGKTIYLDVLYSRFPKHVTYVEPFSGSGTVLLNKTPSEVEVYNDIDGDLVNFFRVLRDREKAEHLMDILYLTPWSREELKVAREILNGAPQEKEKLSDIERARLYFTMMRQSFGATGGSGWSVPKRSRKVDTWHQAISRLEPFIDRLMRVHIENSSFEKMFQLYDTTDTFFYCDPPYKLSTRTAGKVYRNEIKDWQQEHFLKCVTECKGKVIVSGYADPQYDQRLKGWQRVEIKGLAYSAKVAEGQQRAERVEVLWIKPNTIRSDSLWDEVPMVVRESAEEPILQ